MCQGEAQMQLVRMVESHASLHRDVFFFFSFCTEIRHTYTRKHGLSWKHGFPFLLKRKNLSSCQTDMNERGEKKR